MKGSVFRTSFFSFEEGRIEENRLSLLAFSIKNKGIGVEDEGPSRTRGMDGFRNQGPHPTPFLRCRTEYLFPVALVYGNININRLGAKIEKPHDTILAALPPDQNGFLSSEPFDPYGLFIPRRTKV
jgi:hypothetical protein